MMVSGTGHAEDLNYIFYRRSQFNVSEDDRLMQRKMTRLWTNFAKFRYAHKYLLGLYLIVVFLEIQLPLATNYLMVYNGQKYHRKRLRTFRISIKK